MSQITERNIIAKFSADVSSLEAGTRQGATAVKSLETQTVETGKKIDQVFEKSAKSVDAYSQAEVKATGESKKFSTQTNLLQRALGNLDRGLQNGISRLTGWVRQLQLIPGAITSATGALRIFATVIATTGVGALILALGALANSFRGLQGAIDTTSNISVGFGNVISKLRDRVADFITDLSDGKGFREASKNFANLTAQITASTAAAVALNQQAQRLFRTETAFLTERQKLLTKEAELKALIFDEDTKILDKQRAIAELEATTAERFQKEIELQKENVRIAEQRAKLAKNNDQDNRNLANQQVALLSLSAQQADAERSISLIKRRVNREAKQRKETEEDINKELQAQIGSLVEIQSRVTALQEIVTKIALDSEGFGDSLFNYAAALALAKREQKLFNDEVERLVQIFEDIKKPIEEIPAIYKRDTLPTFKELSNLILQQIDLVDTFNIRNANAEEKRKAALEDIKQNTAQLITVSAALTAAFLADETDRLDAQVRAQEQRVKRFEQLAQEGNTKQLELEEERLNRLLELRAEAARRERAITALQITSANALSAATAIQAVISGFSKGNILLGIANAIALTTTIASTILAVKNATASIPAFAEGTEKVTRQNGEPRGKDTILARLDEGERVVPTKFNRHLEGISNEMLPVYAKIGKEVTNKRFAMPQGKGSTIMNFAELQQEMQMMRKDIKNLRMVMSVDNYGLMAGLESAQNAVKRKNNLKR